MATSTYEADFSVFINWARARLGDRSVDDAEHPDPILTDAEYHACFVLHGGDWTNALCEAAEMMIATYLHQPTQMTTENSSYGFSDRIQALRNIIAANSPGFTVRHPAVPSNAVSDEF